MAGQLTEKEAPSISRQRGEWCPEQGGEADASKGWIMTYYAYILRCEDNSLYVGHTDDLRLRVDTHRAGRGARHTAKHGVAQLIFSEEHATEQAAIARELQLKKWSRAKKVALANGDVGRLRGLSRSRDEQSPEGTSPKDARSARTSI